MGLLPLERFPAVLGIKLRELTGRLVPIPSPHPTLDPLVPFLLGSSMQQCYDNHRHVIGAFTMFRIGTVGGQTVIKYQPRYVNQ